jgi:hypothetical protein
LPVVKEFQIIDPNDAGKNLIQVVPGNSAKGLNLYQKRSTKIEYNYTNKKNEYYEKLSLLAFEG